MSIGNWSDVKQMLQSSDSLPTEQMQYSRGVTIFLTIQTRQKLFFINKELLVWQWGLLLGVEDIVDVKQYRTKEQKNKRTNKTVKTKPPGL